MGTKQHDQIDLENILVLVAKNSPNILKLTQDCRNDLLGDAEGSQLHTLEFESHPGKVLRYHRVTHAQHAYQKWCRIGLKDADEEKSPQDTLANWRFREPYFVINIHEKEYVLSANWFHIEEGTCITGIHWKDEKSHTKAVKSREKDGGAFVVNKDGFISPRDCSETEKLYLGIKGKMTKTEREHFLLQVQTAGGYIFHNDTAQVRDTLGEDIIAKCLANHLAGKRLEPPFALGIFGEWGAGKSTFFELMKKRLIDIQKEEVPRNELEMIHAGHIYCVEFNAWTYYRGNNIWASLMYRIFNDLNNQLEIEEWLEVSKKGGFSSIEVNEAINKGERQYLRQLLGGTKDEKEIKKIVHNLRNGLTSKSFASVFEKQVKDDKEDLEAVKKEKIRLEEEKKQWEKQLEEEKKQWEKQLEEREREEAWRQKIDELKMSAIDSIQQRVVRKVLAEHSDNIENAAAELAKNQETLQTLFHEKFSCCEQIWAHTKSSRISAIILTASVSGMLIVLVWVWVEYGDNIIAKLLSLFAPLISLMVGVSNIIKNGTEVLKEQSEKFANEIKLIQDGVAILHPDIEAMEVDENPALLSRLDQIEKIQEKEKEIKEKEENIRQVQRRLKVVAGQSVHEVVKARVNDDKYESMLGTVHSAKKDLDALSDAMFNKYHDDMSAEDGEKRSFPRGKPRIVIFIDDLDRCDPDKLVEVLEALHLLVKSKLFVIVAAMNLQYICSSLEMKKYEGILHSHKCPTGLDYLEKIFQLGYRIPAVISKSNMENYIDWQFRISADGEEPEGSNGAVGRTGNDNIKDEEKRRLDSGTYIYKPQFTSKESQMLKKTCVLFKLTPRSTKRIINVFRLIKQIGLLKGDSLDPTLQRHNFLLLVMASSSETKIGMQKIFSMMESSTMPMTNSKADDCTRKMNLSKLVKENCSSICNANDIDSLQELDQYTFNNRDEWKEVSYKFRLARSFSFFRQSEQKEYCSLGQTN